MNRELDYVLNYMVKYTKDRFMQDSEPMLNHKDIEIVLKHIYELEQENKQLKELKYKFFDCGDEESFTLEDYLEISNELYDYEEENKQLKDGLHKILDLNKRAINCDSQKVTIKYLLKQYDLIYETLGELQPGLMKGDKE